jgi:hypothetical protein
MRTSGQRASFLTRPTSIRNNRLIKLIIRKRKIKDLNKYITLIGKVFILDLGRKNELPKQIERIYIS